MSSDQNFDLPEDQPLSASRGSRLPVLPLLLVALLSFAAFQPNTVRAAWQEFEKVIGLSSAPLQASPAMLSEHESDDLATMDVQHQAERLLERTINHYSGAIEMLGSRVGEWNGRLTLNPHLSGLLETGLNSNDLRVRAASLEIELAAYNVPKTSAGVELLVGRISEASNRYWALWLMGALGNRGVEPDRAFSVLMDHIKDSDEMTRFWTVEGMALLGSDNTIRPLLDVFHSDPSAKVRERAACSLAQSGMLTKDQRMTAAPEIINFLDDTSLDAATRGWAGQALRDITGANLGSDPGAWRAWLADHNTR